LPMVIGVALMFIIVTLTTEAHLTNIRRIGLKNITITG